MRPAIFAIVFVKAIFSLLINSTIEVPSEFVCIRGFENATGSSNCTRYENTTCEFECNSGYVRASNDVNMTLLCTREGWKSTERLCNAYQCDKELNNATASQNCSRLENTSCEFGCNQGYSMVNNDTDMNLTCTRQGWDVADMLCIKVFQCEKEFDNASASDSCTLLENTTCEFHCNSGYVQSNSTENMTLTCSRSGWVGQNNLCDEEIITTKTHWSDQIVLGLVIAVGAFILVLALIVLVTIIQKRRIKNHIAGFSNVAVRYTTSNVGIDNPAYKSEINGYPDSRVIIEDPEGEESAAGENRTDAARYSLSGLEGVDLDMDDSAVLTSESWQREKSVFPEHLQ